MDRSISCRSSSANQPPDTPSCFCKICASEDAGVNQPLNFSRASWSRSGEASEYISCWQSGLILLTKELWGLLISYEAYEHSLYMASYGVGVAISLNISYLQKGGSLSSWPRSCEAPWTPTRPMNTPRKVKVIEVKMKKKTFSRDFSKDFKRCKI